MQIVHVVRQFYPFVGGLENFVLSLAREQVKLGHAVRVVTLNRLFTEPDTVLADTDVLDGITIHRVAFAGSSRYPLAPGVLKHLKGADIVHVQAVDFFCDFLAATRFIHRKPLAISTHGGFFHTSYASRLKRIFFNTVTRASLRGYRRVFACSTNDYEVFHRIARDRVTLVENGVDIEKFADAGAVEFAPRLITIGRISANKGLLNLVDAFGAVVKSYPGARLEVVGNDYDGTLEMLMARVRELPYRDQIGFHAGLSDAAVRRLMDECSFFVSASQYEGFGLTLIETMAAGLLPIANTIPSYTKIIGDAGLGLLTDFAQPDLAGEEMVRFMEASAENYAAAQAKAKSAVARYNWAATASRFMAHYERVLGVSKRELFGVDIAVTTRQDVVSRIDAAVGGDEQLFVAFANAHTLNIAAGSPDYQKTLQRFLVLNDGLGVDLASRIRFRRSFIENLNGTDFIPRYLSASRHRLRIYLLGASPAVIAEASRLFASTWPQHLFVGARNGYFNTEVEIEQACADIRASRPDIVLVGLGNPLQEQWIAAHGAKTGAKALFGVGALFDFTAGRVPRAPLWVRSMRCEWLFRLVQEPRRLWRRYLVGNTVFLVRMLTQPHSVARE